MPNAIKYSTTIPTGSLLKGTVALGVTTASISGPTSTTGWYYGPNPVAGKYQIIETAASGDPDVYCPQSDAELIQFVKTKGATGADTASLSASLAWIGTQSNLMAANFEYENIVTDGLIVSLDAGFVGSYPTTASTWYDISGNNTTGSLINGPTFSSANSGSIVFDRVDDYVSFNINASNIYNAGELTYNVWYKVISSQQDTSLLEIGGNWNNWSLYWDLADSTGSLSFSITGNYFSRVTATTNTKTGAWFNSCGTFGSNSAKIYTNGILENTRNSISLLNQTGILEGRIANDAVNSRLGGNVAITQIYNRALSAQEVLQNYNAQKGRFGL
jgi:hypothetical protein